MNVTLKLKLTCFALLLSNLIYAQTGKLKGTVKDSTGRNVESASVLIKDTKFATATDRKGNYEIDKIPSGNYTVIVNIVGYNSTTNNITIKEKETSGLNFNLAQKIQQLKTVTINSSISINGMGHLEEVHDGMIYSGKKSEVIILDSIDANTAQNNPREILGRIPGSNYSETEGGGFPANGIALRGLRPTQSIEIQTRQNGYNIAADLYGYPETYYVPPLEALEKIEVIRGAASLQFGPQFGGIINYVVRDGPEDKPIEVNVQQTGGSYSFYNSFGSVGGTVQKINYTAFVQYKSTQGYRPNSDVSQISGFAKVEYRASEKFKVGLEYSILRNRIHMAGGLDDIQFNKDPGISTRARNWLRSPWNIIVLTSTYKFSDRTQLSLKSSFNTSARELIWRNEDGGIQTPDSISPFTDTFVPREVEHEDFKSLTNELRFLTRYKLLGNEHTLVAGFRYFQGGMKRQEGGPGSVDSDFDMKLYGGIWENDLDFTTRNFAPYFENTFHIGKRLSVTPGFRFEYIRSSAKGYITDPDNEAIVHANLYQYWNLPLAGLGIQYKTTNTTNIYANISEAYEPTNYSALSPLGGTSLVDPDLKDVSGYNADMGWRGRIKEFLNFDVGVFYMTFDDEIGIELRQDIIGNPYTYITNVGKAVHKGIETYVELNPLKALTKDLGIGNISFFNSYSYILATYVDGPFNGNLEEMAPKHIDRLGINYSFKRFSTTFLISNSSESYADANNTFYSEDATVGYIPAYQVMDWSSTFRIKNYNIRFGISNLTNKNYFSLRTGEYPGPGIIPAQPRSIYIGFGAKF
ncbi:MAG: TonB-dependent receptor [Bacteroidota bacterium]